MITTFFFMSRYFDGWKRRQMMADGRATRLNRYRQIEPVHHSFNAHRNAPVTQAQPIAQLLGRMLAGNQSRGDVRS